MIPFFKIVYWFLIRFCRLSKQEKKMEELARKQSLRNQTYVAKDLLDTDCDDDGCGDQADWGDDDDPESPGVREDWDRGLCQMEENTGTEGGGFLSRASSLASIKIRHQLTVLRMFFGNNNNNNK